MGYLAWQGKRWNTIIEMGGEAIEIKPMGLESSIRLVLLMAPYILKIEAFWPQIQENLESGRPSMATLLFRELGHRADFLPGDIVTAYSLLLDRPVEWIAQNATVKDLDKALSAIDEANGGFKALWEVCCKLGIVIR